MPDTDSASSSVAHESSGQRLFFALWPDAELQASIFNYTKSLKTSAARLPPVENLHLTLLFLGQVNKQQQDCLQLVANSLILPGFELTFGELVYRRGQHMLWLQPKVSVDGLQLLVTRLRQRVADCGLRLDSRPFCAHMTLLRKLLRPPLDLAYPNIIWPVRDFALVASKTLPTGAQYRIVKKWHLS